MCTDDNADANDDIDRCFMIVQGSLVDKSNEPKRKKSMLLISNGGLSRILYRKLNVFLLTFDFVGL